MRSSLLKLLSVLGIACTLAVNPAFADKPEWAGKQKPEKHEKREKRGKKEKRAYQSGTAYFTQHDRVVVSEYYGRSYQKKGKCPPGLAKKNNGCLPPGQAKKWQMGQPVPHGVRLYSVPNSLVVQLGIPPQGYKYVRVSADILMIAIGSRMVVDAITDLGRI